MNRKPFESGGRGEQEREHIDFSLQAEEKNLTPLQLMVLEEVKFVLGNWGEAERIDNEAINGDEVFRVFDIEKLTSAIDEAKHRFDVNNIPEAFVNRCIKEIVENLIDWHEYRASFLLSKEFSLTSQDFGSDIFFESLVDQAHEFILSSLEEGRLNEALNVIEGLDSSDDIIKTREFELSLWKGIEIELCVGDIDSVLQVVDKLGIREALSASEDAKRWAMWGVEYLHENFGLSEEKILKIANTFNIRNEIAVRIISLELFQDDFLRDVESFLISVDFLGVDSEVIKSSKEVRQEALAKALLIFTKNDEDNNATKRKALATIDYLGIDEQEKKNFLSKLVESGDLDIARQAYNDFGLKWDDLTKSKELQELGWSGVLSNLSFTRFSDSLMMADEFSLRERLLSSPEARQSALMGMVNAFLNRGESVGIEFIHKFADLIGVEWKTFASSEDVQNAAWDGMMCCLRQHYQDSILTIADEFSLGERLLSSPEARQSVLVGMENHFYWQGSVSNGIEFIHKFADLIGVEWKTFASSEDVQNAAWDGMMQNLKHLANDLKSILTIADEFSLRERLLSSPEARQNALNKAFLCLRSFSYKKCLDIVNFFELGQEVVSTKGGEDLVLEVFFYILRADDVSKASSFISSFKPLASRSKRFLRIFGNLGLQIHWNILQDIYDGVISSDVAELGVSRVGESGVLELEDSFRREKHNFLKKDISSDERLKVLIKNPIFRIFLQSLTRFNDSEYGRHDDVIWDSMVDDFNRRLHAGQLKPLPVEYVPSGKLEIKKIGRSQESNKEKKFVHDKNFLKRYGQLVHEIQEAQAKMKEKFFGGLTVDFLRGLTEIIENKLVDLEKVEDGLVAQGDLERPVLVDVGSKIIFLRDISEALHEILRTPEMDLKGDFIGRIANDLRKSICQESSKLEGEKEAWKIKLDSDDRMVNEKASFVLKNIEKKIGDLNRLTSLLNNDRPNFDELISRFVGFDTSIKSLRQGLIFLSFLMNPRLLENDYSNLAEGIDRQDVSEDEISKVINFIDQVTNRETFGVFLDDKEKCKILDSLLSVSSLKQEINRLQEAKSPTGKTTSVAFIPSRDLKTEISGHMADACWANKEKSILQSHPNFISVTFVGNPESEVNERVVGACILIETKTRDNAPIIVIRGFNPIENFTNSVDQESFFSQFVNWVRPIAKLRGCKLAMVIDGERGLAASNRQVTYDYLASLRSSLEKVTLASSVDTSFNGYYIVDDTYLIPDDLFQAKNHQKS
ncbi:TPA: hypothetical protein DEP86_01675 [Candidatus Uhrbacteria bacterium]|nr:hypothetical protein [Candidatus Uhrbacteria bacterium]